jgi:AcrR family transcriptional regulator
MKLGRPREFDFDKALDKALAVFWEKGYEGASLPDLTEAMGINRPSLYAAFGNKEGLFRRAMERYEEGPASYVREALAQPTARKVVESLFAGGIDVVAGGKNPGGCFAVQAALACGDDARVARAVLAERRQAAQLALRKRLLQAKAEGDLPKNAGVAALARYVFTVMHGMAVQAAGGATKRELQAVAKTAMKAWPT